MGEGRGRRHIIHQWGRGGGGGSGGGEGEEAVGEGRGRRHIIHPTELLSIH